tara:strand:- start:1952 stop:5566 length:3615 start_codon:yes stop_codon:yes gene_type:complete
MSQEAFQIYDWETYDEEVDNDDSDSNNEFDSDDDTPKISQNFVTYIYALTKTGQNVSIKVTGFTPYFYIELPHNWKQSWTSIFAEEIKESLPKNMRGEFIEEYSTKALRKRFKFRTYQWDQTTLFMQLVFKSDKAARYVYYRLKDPYKGSIYALRKHQFPIYEKNIPPVLRLIHIQKIKPSGWISLGKSAVRSTRPTLCETEFPQNWTVHWKDVHPIDIESIGPIKVASFDIEADSSHGDFPVAKKDYYKLAMNIYEENVRYQKSKKRTNPTLISMWIKAAFRDYNINDKYDEYTRSSIQTIILKYPYDIENKLFDTLGDECYVCLTKHTVQKTKSKEIVESLKQILNSYLPPVKGDKVIQIGTVCYRYGQEKTSIQRHIVALGGCDDLEGIEVVPCNSVRELFEEWLKFMRKSQPNVITGYNIFGFDFKFLWECAEEYDCLDLLKQLGPRKSKQNKLVEKTLSSSALGVNIMFYFQMPGIVTIDLLKVIQKDHNLSSYKLDDVSNEFIHGAITAIEHLDDSPNCSITLHTKSTFSLLKGHYVVIFKESIIGKEFIGERRQIIDLVENTSITLEEGDNSQELPKEPKSYYWAVGKDNVSPQDIFEKQRGTDSDRAIVAKYCVQDCELCLHLIQKLEIITNNVGMSNVCLVPFPFLFMRGQMIKTLSLVASECQKEKYLIPELPRPPEDTKDSYEGAEVLEPTPAIFLKNPVSVLDYGSLYPSSMIGSNISHDSIIVEPQYQGESGAKLLESMGIKFQDISYDNYYQELKGKTWVKKVDTKNPVVNCRYIQPSIHPETGKIDDTKRGILPRILMKLLAARKATRAQIKNEKDPFRISVLDGLQLAYKVTANSLYGGVGAEVSSLYYKDIAASTTAVGRRHLHLAKDYVKEHYPKAEIVYGDTDSIFVNFNVHDGLDQQLSNSEALQKSIDLSVEVENGIQSLLEYPHKLEYEKTFYPFLLLRKKGYVGNKYEFDLNKYKQSSMGVVTKRRDNAPIVKYVYDGIIKRIMNDRDIQAAIQFLLDCFKQILKGNFPIQYFIVTKQLKAQYAFPDRVVHKVLADRMGERDPGNKPQSNDRLPYAYVKTKTIPKLQGDRVEHPDYIKENNLSIDYLFYITNQIQKPVCQVFALALEELRVHGYKLPVDHFDRMKKQLQNGEKKLEPSQIREKIMDKKMDEVYKVLFQKMVKVEEGKRYGQKQISDFFSKR